MKRQYTSLKIASIKGILKDYEDAISDETNEITIEDYIRLDNCTCNFIKKICELNNEN